MNKQLFKEAIQKFPHFKVLIIGDVMIDNYMWGAVERISPEAPVPVVTCKKQEKRMGGAANVALNVQSLGAIPILCSVIGNDDRGSIFYELLRKKNLTDKGILVDEQRSTTMKTRIISDNHHLLRIDEEVDMILSQEMEEKFIQNLREIINTDNISAVIFEDYDKGVITPRVILNIVELANEKGIPTLVDPKKRNFNFYRNVTLFKPNFKELAEGLKSDMSKNQPETIFGSSRLFQSSLNIQWLLVTLSEKGVVICEQDKYSLIPAHIRDIADVSGAGDTVIGTASLCLAAGLGPFDTAFLSNLAGGIVCEKVGVVPIEPEQLIKEIDNM